MVSLADPKLVPIMRGNCDRAAASGQAVYAPSSIAGAGNGVFDTRSALKDAILCYYDSYVKPISQITPLEGRYAISTGVEGEGRIGYMVPRKQHPGGLGQFINDAAASTVPDTESHSAVVRVMVRYMVDSLKLANVTSSEDGSVIIALRPLEAGEELYVHYGGRYWLDDLRGRTTSVLQQSANQVLTRYVLNLERTEMLQQRGG